MKLKRKLLEINFNPSGKGDYVARDGEVESCVATNSWVDPDSVRGVGVGEEDVSDDEDVDSEENDLLTLLSPKFILPPGHRLLCIHSGCSFHPSERLIMQNDDGALVFAHAANPTDLHEIASEEVFPEFSKGLSSGDTVVLLSISGLTFLTPDRDGGYSCSSGQPERPVIEFSLEPRPLSGFSLLSSEWPHG